MTTTLTETMSVSDRETRHCPLCGAVLDPLSDDVLCPICRLDQDEKLADHRAEQEQARFPF